MTGHAVGRVCDACVVCLAHFLAFERLRSECRMERCSEQTTPTDNIATLLKNDMNLRAASAT